MHKKEIFVRIVTRLPDYAEENLHVLSILPSFINIKEGTGLGFRDSAKPRRPCVNWFQNARKYDADGSVFQSLKGWKL